MEQHHVIKMEMSIKEQQINVLWGIFMGNVM